MLFVVIFMAGAVFTPVSIHASDKKKEAPAPVPHQGYSLLAGAAAGTAMGLIWGFANVLPETLPGWILYLGVSNVLRYALIEYIAGKSKTDYNTPLDTATMHKIGLVMDWVVTLSIKYPFLNQGFSSSSSSRNTRNRW